jgi:hypothetical protein
MGKKTTVTFVNLSDIYDHLQLTDDEVGYIGDFGFNCVSFGDAFATLIRPRYTLNCMVEAYEKYHTEVIANKSMTKDDFIRKYWEVVDSNDYINLEN